MEKGDLITLIGGVVLVFVIALVMNPHYLSGIPEVGGKQVATPVPVVPSTVPGTPVQTVVTVTPLTAAVTITPMAEPTIAPPYRLFYNSSPFSYPRFKMPDNIYIYGAGDIPFRGREMVTFAFINESRGGLSQRFRVPYPVWSLNATVTAERTPQYGNFKVVLCYADNGTVIDGMEILNRGSMTRNVQVSGADLYMIITTAYIDSYQIDLETPKDYYFEYKDR
ncbi:hypothetical protein [Methanoregula sp.]|uniref:hypothetical protein n=1 Tax=Methanoregula sp. TaxID=2052170 RepID=UPI00262059C2|nr:hypothetical protein [Methanoregula sp.]MDD5143669.1 hypothetical protein [Methanoregula sp.]